MADTSVTPTPITPNNDDLYDNCECCVDVESDSSDDDVVVNAPPVLDDGSDVEDLDVVDEVDTVTPDEPKVNINEMISGMVKTYNSSPPDVRANMRNHPKFGGFINMLIQQGRITLTDEEKSLESRYAYQKAMNAHNAHRTGASARYYKAQKKREKAKKKADREAKKKAELEAKKNTTDDGEKILDVKHDSDDDLLDDDDSTLPTVESAEPTVAESIVETADVNTTDVVDTVKVEEVKTVVKPRPRVVKVGGRRINRRRNTRKRK
jgi:hypothetical protein